MFYREPWRPILAVGLTAAFATLSWFVRLTRGNPWLIKRKLKLGALLLGVNSAIVGCDIGREGVALPPCSGSVLPDDVHFDAAFLTDGGLVLDVGQGSALTGTIREPTHAAYAFRLLFEEAELQRGVIVANDGAFDEASESFFLALDPDQLPPKAELRLYHGAPDSFTVDRLIDQFRLTVVNRP